MGVVHDGALDALDVDEDDYRPESALRLIVDPDGRVNMTVIHERIAAGDRIPRHRHDVDEIIVVQGGRGRVHLDGIDTDVAAGSVIFVPAGAVHGTRNIGEEVVEIRALFPTTTLRMEMVERNPKPGTEDRVPQISVYDARTGEFRVLGPTDLTER
jgi:quercetin dioxygenase-like cupin family protein